MQTLDVMRNSFYRRWKWLALLSAFTVPSLFADVYLGIDGGLEGSATVDNSTTYSSAQASTYTKENATTTIAEETTHVRSGGKALRVRNASTTGRRVRSPLSTFSSKTTGITIQYYRLITNITHAASNQVGIVRSSGESLQGTYARPTSANTWEKHTYSPASATFTSLAGVWLMRGPGDGTGDNVYIDDVAMYDGSVDTTAPNSPGSLTVNGATASSLDLSWGAASGGVDSGGYLAVRYTSNPASGDDPNANGIYASNNVIPGTVSGTVVYQGTGTSFTDSGLSSGQTYYYKVYTYDKAYNYSAEVTGNGTTTASCTPVGSLTLVQQTNHYTKFTSGGDIFNVDSARMGMWANSGSEQSVAWRNFRTEGSGGGEQRELQPGDRFRITINGPNPNGRVGVSINDGAATGSWNNRTNNTRGFIQVQGGGANDYFVTHNGGTPAWSGVRPNSTDQTLVFDILSSHEFTANIEGQAAKYDLTMLNSPGDSDRVDGFSIFLNDDTGDVHWKQITMVTNLGYVEFGADNGTRDIVGKVTDSTDPACTNTASPNLLRKTGTGTVTLQNTANTYTMGTRVEAGTLAVFNDGSLGAAPGSAVATNLNIWSGGTLRATNTFTLNANRGIALGDVNGPSIDVDSGKTLTYAGVLGGNADWNKKGAGIMALTGTANTNNGKITIQNGTLRIAADGSLGAVPGSAAEKINIWDTGTFEADGTFTLHANRRIEVGTISAPKLSVTAGNTLTYGGQISGSANWSKESAGTLTLTGASTASGTLVVNAGVVNFNGTNTSQAVGVTAAGFLYGNGSIGALTITGQVSAGSASNIVGNLRSSSLNLQSNGRMQVNFSAMTGTAGTDWDVITVGGGSGTYTVNAVDGSDFVIALKGSPSFDNTLGYTNIIIDASTASSFVSNKFTISTDEFTPALGGGTFTVDADSGNLRLIFTPAAVAAPDIAVLGTNGAVIANNDNSPAATDGTDFGTVLYAGTYAVTNVFSITNSGASTLTISAVTTNSGMGAAGDFIVLSFPASVSAGALSNLVVAFNPAATGTRTAAVVIANSDSAKNPYTFAVSGVGAVTNPVVSTTIASATNLTTATAGGNVTDDGGATVTNRGVVWALDPATPTVPGAQTTNGTGTGSYSSTLTNLTPGATYNYRAFAQNSAGTGYGTQYSLTTPCFSGIVTGLVASVTNETDFTAAWSNFSGATGYALDVSTNATFIGDFATTAQQDFETSPATPTATYSASGGGFVTGNSASGDRPASSPFYSGGARAYAINNGTATLTFDAIDTSSLTEPTLSMRLASFSIGSTGNGADVGDIVTVEISPNNGTTYYSTVRVLGNGNAYWSYAGGTGIASTSYDGDTSPVDFQPAGGGNRTTDGYSTIIVSNLPAVSQMRIRVTMLNNSGNEQWTLDDVVLSARAESMIPGYSSRLVAGTSQSVTGLTGGVTYYFRVRATNDYCATGNSTTANVTTISYVPDIAVLGTNLATIVISNTAPAIANGTDFGAIGVNFSNRLHTFTITNNGTATLGVGNVTTSGTHAADFVVVSQPSASIAAGGTSTFQVRFDPNAEGERNATLTFTNTVPGKTPFPFAVRGTGVLAGIGYGPASTSVTTMVGTTPSAASFGVTNVGRGRLDYAITTNASWLSVSPVSANLDEGGSQGHTISFNVTGLSAGTSNATVWITDLGASNSPQTVAVTLILTNIPDPTAVSAWADGREMIRLGWTRPTGLDVMIVYRETNAPSAPTQGQGYSVGDTYGGNGSRVVYKGGAAQLEHVVLPGRTNHYALYAINNNHYSPGVTTNLYTTPYPAGEMVEVFAYTNTGTLATSGHGGGGNGWTNSWQGDTGNFNISSGSFANISSYPTNAANRVRINSADIDGTSKIARRHFAAYTTGKVYAAYILNFAYNGANKFAGMSFMDGATEELFFGEGYDDDQKLAVGGTTTTSNVYAGVGNDYLIIGMYDFTADTGYALAYKIGTDTVPDTEPSTWHGSFFDNSITRIDGIRIAAGAGGGSGTPGDTYFDEVRVATSWELLLANYAQPEIDVLGTNRAVLTTANTPDYDNGTDFGATAATGGQVDRTLFITNAGAGMLNVSGITTSGAQAADFIVVSWPTKVSPGAVSNLVLRFAPNASGLRTGAVTVASDDADEGIYVFHVRGTGQVPPTVTTTIATATNQTTATAGGNVSDDGYASVTNRGVVWSTLAGPTVPGAQTTNGTGTGSYSSTLTNLTPGATYYYRSFAQNSAGTGYGSEYTLTTFCFGGTVTGHYASATNDVNFTVVWSNFAGASGYALDVSSNEGFTVSADNYGAEAFTNIGGGTTSSYLTRQWTNNGIAWTAYLARTDQTIDSSEAITLQNANGAFLISQPITGGVSEIRVTHQLKFTGADTFDIFVNSTKVATNIAYSSSVQTAVVQNIGVSGSFTIMITNNSGGRVALDNLAWTNGAASSSFVPGYSNRAVSGTSASVTGLVSGATYYYRIRATNEFCTSDNSTTGQVTTIVLPAEIEVLGNGVVIPDGDTTPSPADHTDFGAVGFINSNLVRTFTISNAGPGALSVYGVSTSGAAAADFVVTSLPGTPVNAGATTTFQILFDPTALGTRTATINVSNNVAGKTLYDFVVQGTGVAASLVVAPSSIAVTSVVGSLPAGLGFGVTNNGRGDLIYSVATNVSWLSVSPNAGTNSELQGRQHNLTFTAPGLHVGVSNATITITDTNAVGSPATVAVEWTLTAIPAVVSAGVTNDGNELVRIGWTKDSGYDVMIVHNRTNPPSAPVNGTSYSVGGTVGSDGSRVIYSGSGSELQHVVVAGSDNYYAFYSVNNNHYSTPLSTNTTMGTYAAGEIVEPFAYTSGVTMISRRGGNGWGTNFWIGDTNAFTVSNLSFAAQTNYPTPRANKLAVTPADGGSNTIRRQFTNTFASGRLYVSYIVNFQYDGPGKYVGLSLMSNTTERLFVGEVSTADLRLGLDGSSSNRVMNNGTGNDYIVIMRYDWSSGLAVANAYLIGTDGVPDSEPTMWDMTLAKASNAVGRINGIRLAAGTTGSGTPGDTYFDEIRVATNWNALIQMSPGRVIYDGFAASSGTLSGGSGGTGWSDTWVLGGDPFANYESASFGIEKSSYYQPTGNKIVLYGDVDGRWISATRTFLEPLTNGAVYFSWMMNYEFNGTDKYAGLKLLDGGTEKAFVGKVSGANKALGIDSSSNNQTSTEDLENGSGYDYVIVAKYDFATRELNATSFRTSTNAIAEEPNGYWQVTTTQDVGHITSLTGVRLAIGAGAGVQVGDVYYDEVRVGTNWFEVTRKDGEAQAVAMANGPAPRLLYVGTNYNPALNPQGAMGDITVTDADLANTADPLDIAILWSNSFGVFITNANSALYNQGSRAGRVNPNYDPVVLAGSEFQSLGLDSFFTNFAGNNGSVVVTTYQHRAFNITNSTYDDAYYITVSAENNNMGGGTFTAPNGGDAVPYYRALTVNTALQFFVQDDDIDLPELFEFTIDGVGGSGLSNLSAGAIAVIGVNGTETGDDERFSFVVLAPFPAGTVIEFTDCGWNPTNNGGFGDWHRPTEFHTNKWVATGNIDVGRVIELSLQDINNPGDQVAIFQYSGPTTASNDSANVTFIHAVNLGPRWYEPPGDPIPDNNQSSGLYRGLTNGVTAVSVPLSSGVANARYIGPTTGTASYLLLQIGDSNNWQSLATGYHDITNYSFQVTGAGAFDWNTPEISDAQVLAGGYMVTNVVRDIDSGVLASNTSFGHAPYFMMFNTNAEVVVSNLFVVSFTNGTRTVITNANDTFTGIYERITLGMGEALVAWSDADNDRSLDTLMTTSRVPVLVYDDDPIPPVAGGMILLNGPTPITEQPGPVSLLAAWNFNDSNTTATSGSGTWSDNLLTAPTYPNAGTTINAVTGDPAGADITITGGSGLQNNGRYFQFQLNMTGHDGLVMTYSARRSGTGFTTNIIEYSTDGVTFTAFTTNTPTLDNHALRSNDFSGVTALNNQPAVYIRVTLDGATATAGNNRFDNFQFNAQRRVYSITDGALAAVAATNPLYFSFSVYDATSGVARGTSSDGTNMNISIPGLATNNTANYSNSVSSAGTLSPSSTSLWAFTAFGYTQIGDLYGGGTNLIPVTANISDLDNDRIDDRLQLANYGFGTFFVTDDDTNAPFVANVNLSGAAAAPFVVATNGVAPTNSIRGFISRRSGTGSNTLTTITDQELATASNIQFQFVFGARDAYSGVSRGTMGTTNEVMSFSLGTNIGGNIVDYSVALSTAQGTTNLLLTNYWTFSNFGSDAINELMVSTGNAVRITIPDLDDDRPADRATAYSHLVGYVRVVDDDIRGPIINSADIAGAYGTNVTMYSSFETNQNWPTTSLGSGSPWTNEATTGTWIADGATYGALDPKISGTRRIGLLTNSLAEPRWIQLPPIRDPGYIVLFAGRFSGNDVTLRVERADGASWVSLGDRVVTNLNPEFELFSWDIYESGMTTIRVVHAGTGPQVYIDDISVYPQAIWISTNALRMTWEEAVDDFSTVAQYRAVAPAQVVTQPTATNDGVGFAPTVRTNLFNITGQQGVLTGYLFAVDSDTDRAHDQAIGNLQKLVVRVDTNPPPVPTALRATDAAGGNLFGGIDESSEVLVQWTPPGTNGAQAAGWRQSDSEALSPWDTYIITYHEVADTNGTPIASAITQVITRASAGWSNTLNNWAFTNLVLSNLVFDSYYKVTLQARDAAGNIGLATSVIGNTDRFVVTQGLTRANLGLAVRWTGPTNETTYRDYDVIFVDSAMGFRSSLTNYWGMLAYTNRPNLEDYGGTNRVPPGLLTGTSYRLYRVAREDRWRTNQTPRLASVEIYAAKALRLHPGENWYSLFSLPDPATTNEQESTVAYVFGTNTLYASNTYAQSTRISWFGPTTGATNISTVATSIVWLSSTAGWQYQLGGAGSANEKRVPLGQGFMIELPTNVAPTNLVLIGRLPTQTLSRTISSPVSTNNPEYHVLSHQMTERITVSNFVSQFSGFGAGPTYLFADEIRVLDNRQTNGVGMGSLRSPRMRIWYSSIPSHSSAPWRRVTTGSPVNMPSAMGDIIEPDDAIIVVRRKSGTVTFNNSPTYPSPTRNITP